MRNVLITVDNIVLWLSRLFGGFLIAIAVLAGAIAGLTIRSSHSLNRKMAHLLIAAFGLILTFFSLVRLVRTILFADWLS